MLYVAISFQYFIVDESSGQLLVQGKDQKDANEFANLLLSNVKTCDDVEVDRNFCFQVSVTTCLLHLRCDFLVFWWRLKSRWVRKVNTRLSKTLYNFPLTSHESRNPVIHRSRTYTFVMLVQYSNHCATKVADHSYIEL